jgi:hypothetical protein
VNRMPARMASSGARLPHARDDVAEPDRWAAHPPSRRHVTTARAPRQRRGPDQGRKIGQLEKRELL